MRFCDEAEGNVSDSSQSWNDQPEGTTRDETGRQVPHGSAPSLLNLSKDTVLYAVGAVVTKGFGILTFPLYVNFLSPDQFGLWSYLIAGLGLLVGILTLGGDSAFMRFFGAASDRREQQSIVSTWFAFEVVWGLIFSIAMLWNVRRITAWSCGSDAYLSVFIIAALLVPTILINNALREVLRNTFRPIAFCSTNVIAALLQLSLLFFLLAYLDRKLQGVALAMLLSGIALMPLLVYLTRGMLRPLFSVTVLRQLLAFGVPLAPATLAYWIFQSSDRVILAELCGFEQVGFYAAGCTLANIVWLAIGVISMAWPPYAIRLYEWDREYAKDVFGKIATVIIAGTSVLAVAMCVAAREILSLISPPEYIEAWRVVIPLALAGIAFATTQVTATGITLTKKTYCLTIHAFVAAGMNVVLNYALIPRFGMVAAGWTTLASYSYLTVAFFLTSRWLWHVHYDYRRVGALAFVSIAVIAVSYFRPSLHIGYAAIVDVVLIACHTSLVWVVGFSKSDRRNLWNLGCQLLRAKRHDPDVGT